MAPLLKKEKTLGFIQEQVQEQEQEQEQEQKQEQETVVMTVPPLLHYLLTTPEFRLSHYH